MTELQTGGVPDWQMTLEMAVSAAGHEARNALNGLVVNLEVVRAMAQRDGYDAEPFLSQAVAQAEESIRMSESAISLLKLLLAALGPDGRLVFESAEARQISLDGGPEAERLFGALESLADRGVVGVERSGSTVILRIPQERHE